MKNSEKEKRKNIRIEEGPAPRIFLISLIEGVGFPPKTASK